MRYYIYKLTFTSGASYIGSHIEKRASDGYITSSSYYKNHPEDKLLKRDIILEVKDPETMDIMETLCIFGDKAENNKNVNGNYGNWYYHFCGGRVFKGMKMPEEQKRKLSKHFFKKGQTTPNEWKIKTKEKRGYKIYCLETEKTFNACKDAANGKDINGSSISRSVRSKGFQKANDGNHYLLLEDANKIDDKQQYLENILVREAQGEPVMCIEKNIYFSSISTACKITGITTIYSHLLNKKGYKTAGGYHWKKVSLEDFFNSPNNKKNIYFEKKEYNHNQKKVRCIETGQVFDSATATGINRVSKCVHNPNFTAGGYHWEYV